LETIARIETGSGIILCIHNDGEQSDLSRQDNNAIEGIEQKILPEIAPLRTSIDRKSPNQGSRYRIAR
jgi:hypothetical protein